MATEIDISHRCCHSFPVEQIRSEDTSVSSGQGQRLQKVSTAAGISRKGLKSILLNGSVIVACAIGITVICVGVAALAAIDGLSAINRPEFLSNIPLAFVLLVSPVVGVGIVYLMVQALLAMGDDFDYGD